jgi:chromosome segregation ATPase
MNTLQQRMEIEQKIKHAVEKMNILKLRIDSRLNQIEILNSINKNLEIKLKLETIKKANENSILQSQVKKVNLQVKESESQVKKVNLQVKESESQVKKVDLQVKECESQVKKVNLQVKESESQVKKVNLQVKESESQVKKVNLQVKESESQVKKVNLQVKESELQVKKVNLQVKESESQVKKVEEKQDEHFATFCKLWPHCNSKMCKLSHPEDKIYLASWSDEC